MIPRLRSPVSFWDLLAAGVHRGDETEKFERAFAAQFGFPAALYFPYGRSALHALLSAMGWRAREVWCPSYTCVVVPHAVVLSGNRVRFLDSAEDHFLVPARQWLDCGHPPPAMVIPTPLFGYPIDRPACEAAARRANPDVFVLYDVAQGFGVEDGDGLQTDTADGALFSLGIGKMLSTLFGGILALRDEALYREVRAYRDRANQPPPRTSTVRLLAYGMATWAAFREPALTLADALERRTRVLDRFTVYYYGKSGPEFPADYAVRPGALQARLGLKQLPRYNNVVETRRQLGAYYEELLAAEGIQSFGHSATPTYSIFPLWVGDRGHVLTSLRAQGVQAGVLNDYACSDLPGYESHRGAYPHASRWGAGMINLPNWPGLGRPGATRVVEALLRCRDRLPAAFALGGSLAA